MLKSAWEKTGHLLIIGGMVYIIYAVGSGDWGGSLSTRWYWIIGIMTLFVLVLGLTVNGRADGALIDWRNKMSLSHLQVILWTILGMSAFITIGFDRIANMKEIKHELPKAYQQARAVGEIECVKGLAEKDITQDVLDTCSAPDALQIIFPEELLLAMGISLASFAGSSLVKSNQATTTLVSSDEQQNKQDEIRREKQTQKLALAAAAKINQEIIDMKSKLELATNQANNDDIQSANAFIAAKTTELTSEQKIVEDASKKIEAKEKELQDLRESNEKAKGLLHIRDNPKEAQWSDLFKKELSGESDLIDLSKLQMFFFTVTIIFAYAGALNSLMEQTELIRNPFGVALPLFSSSLVVLLGISHGGYLAIKNTSQK